MLVVFYALFMGVMAGLLMPWVVTRPKQRKRYEERKALYEAGRGKDPDKDIIGPHKSFAVNAFVAGGLFAAVGAGIGIGVGL